MSDPATAIMIAGTVYGAYEKKKGLDDKAEWERGHAARMEAQLEQNRKILERQGEQAEGDTSNQMAASGFAANSAKLNDLSMRISEDIFRMVDQETFKIAQMNAIARATERESELAYVQAGVDVAGIYANSYVNDQKNKNNKKGKKKSKTKTKTSSNGAGIKQNNFSFSSNSWSFD